MKGACDKSVKATGIDQKQKEGGERGENINRRVLIGGEAETETETDIDRRRERKNEYKSTTECRGIEYANV